MAESVDRTPAAAPKDERPVIVLTEANLRALRLGYPVVTSMTVLELQSERRGGLPLEYDDFIDACLESDAARHGA